MKGFPRRESDGVAACGVGQEVGASMKGFPRRESDHAPSGPHHSVGWPQ